jgi:rhamnosyltransferase
MTLSQPCDDVFAVIVTFNPDLDVLDALVQRLLPQVGAALIVDNGSTVNVAAWHAQRGYARVELRLVGENLGIAAAQNIGMGEARSRGVQYVLLSDQDSQPAPDMVFQLRKTIRQLTAEGVKVAAVGPRYLLDERRDEPPPFVRVRGLRVPRAVCRDSDSVVQVDYVIASGCLIPIEAVNAVGQMKEEMFIDYVDIEWGLRARRCGYRSYGVCAAAMTHSIGDSPITLLGKRYLVHSPLRHYYHFRNAAWLYKQKYVPLQWKLADGLRLATRYLFYTFFARPRLSHCRMMTIGLFDGVRSRLGRCEVA